ncbi:MAG: hypothetical protein R3B68_14700 [Phycisphaerales bacterium]
MTRTSPISRPGRLFLACGAAAALLAPGALAQSQNQPGSRNDQNRQSQTNQPGQQRTTQQPGQFDNRDARNDAPSILQRLEGVWRVEMRVNPAVWSNRQNWNADRMNNDAIRDPMRDGTERTNPSATTPSRDNPNQPSSRDGARNPAGSNTGDGMNQPGSRTNPSAQDQNRQDRFNDRDNAMHNSLASGQSTFYGIAQTSLIMDGNIMQERLNIMGADPSQTGLTPATSPSTTRDADRANQNRSNPGGTTNNQDRDARVPGDANRVPGFNQNPEGFDRDDQQPMQSFDSEQFRQEWTRNAARWSREDAVAECLSFISFDPDTQTYSAVFMNSIDGSMHQCSGTYDASSRRIVFEGVKPNGMHNGAGVGQHNNQNNNQHVNANPGAHTDPARIADPSRTANQPAGADSHHQGDMASRAWSHNNVRVELELFGDDMIRVTMFDSMAFPGDRWNTQPGTPDSQRSNTGTNSNTGNMNDPANNNANQPNRQATNQPNRPTAAQPGQNQPSSTNAYPIAGAAPTTIVFQATYTRADASEASRIRGLLNNDFASVDTDR